MKTNSRWLWVAGVFLFLATTAWSQAAPSLAITHVTVINLDGIPSRPDQTVLISGTAITSEGPFSRIKIPKDARVIEGRGKFLIPGLWDMHVHLAGVNADPVWSKQVLLPLLLANGIVGVRDMGGDLNALLAWQREISSGSLLGPTIVASGPWLAAEGKKTPEQFPVANAEEARAAVRDIKQRGANFIKIISLPSRDAFFAVADEAKKQNIPFAGHLPLEINAGEASDAGMQSIEHLFFSGFALSVSSKEAELRRQLVEAQEKHDSTTEEKITLGVQASYDLKKAAALFQTLKKNGTWVTVTLAWLAITAHPENWRADDPQLAFVPPALAKEWRDSISGERVKQRDANMARRTENDWKLTGELHRAGVPILVGSDSLDPFVFPGESLHRELAELVRAGFTPLEALQAATTGALNFLKQGEKGAVIPSESDANLVLLDANPLENISNTRKIAGVIYRGLYLDRAKLDSMLEQAKTAAAAVK